MSDKQLTAYQRLCSTLLSDLQARFNGFLLGCAGDVTRALVTEFVRNGFGVSPIVVLMEKDGKVEGVVAEDHVD